MDNKIEFKGSIPNIDYLAEVGADGICGRVVLTQKNSNGESVSIEFDTEEMADFVFYQFIKPTLNKE